MNSTLQSPPIVGAGEFAAAPRARRAARMRLCVPAAEIPWLVAVSLAVAALSAPWYLDDSPWIGPGIALSVFVAWHSLRATVAVPWFPGIVAFGACVQWVLAPWVVFTYQDRPWVSPMAVTASDYFAFAVPAALALVIGMYLPLARRAPTGVHRGAMTVPIPATLRTTCDLMVIGGLFARVVVAPVTPGSLRFFIQLIGLLAWVGAFGLLLLRAPGWHYRLGAVLGVVAINNVADMQFLDLMTWCLCSGLLLAYRFKPRLRIVLPALAVIGAMFLALNAFKRMHRDEIRQMQLDRSERVAMTGSTIYALARDPAIVFGPDNLVGNFSRLNEGFIIARIMAWVPSAEPFARGETVAIAVRSALVPRVLYPDKFVVGGAEVIPRFTGIQLINGTSMGLSVPGELYANFGKGGALAGTFVYGVLLGSVFAYFVGRSRRTVVWSAWVPFLVVSTFSAEQGLAEVLNQMSKAAIVMAGVLALAPAWAELRRRERRRPGGKPTSAPA